MSKASLRRHLRNRILHLNSQIAALERESAKSGPLDRVKLAAEAKILRERKEEREDRLARLDGQPDGFLSDFNAELAEGADDILLSIQRWVDKH